MECHVTKDGSVPQSETTLERQMWSWSPEGVEPAASFWQEGAHPSVLQRCGDGGKPGKEQVQTRGKE